MTRGDTREEATMGEIHVAATIEDTDTNDELVVLWLDVLSGNKEALVAANGKTVYVDTRDLQAEIAALREIVRALVEDESAGWATQPEGSWDHYEYYCVYCSETGKCCADGYPDHTPDCPILAGRAALADGGEQGGA